MVKGYLRVTRMVLMLAACCGGALAQPAALAQPVQNLPYVVPASCAGENDAEITIYNNAFLIHEMNSITDPHPVCGFEIFNSQPGVQPGEITPSAKTSLPSGIYSFDLSGVPAHSHLVLKLATIGKSGKVSNVHELQIPTNGTVAYRVPSQASVAFSATATNTNTAATNTAAANTNTGTTPILPAAADEVSAAIAELFGKYGQEFQELSVQAGNFHAEFVELLNGGAEFYASGEATGNAPSAAKRFSPNVASIPLGIDATHMDVHSANTPFSWCADH